MNEKQLKELGFDLIRQYEHDEFWTKRYENGNLEVELTYEGNTLRTCELTISEINCRYVTLAELKVLTPILGDWH